MSIRTEEYHELTETTETTETAAAEAIDDVPHVNPYDRHLWHVWCFEPGTAQGVLTQDGMTQIAIHKYQAGEYTWLDHALNPTWQWLTEHVLPRHMAPNVVTVLGGLHCLFAYLLTWYCSPQLQQHVPAWVLVVNAWCMAVYYTADCMDGKQARRTQSSSPLGQLLDHGMDGLCLLAHLSSVHAWLCAGGTVWYFVTQAALQFSFFVAQWEEYYTGILPHATGNVGVTEVNYGLALVSLINAIVRLRNRMAFYEMSLVDIVGQRFYDAVLVPLLLLGSKNGNNSNTTSGENDNSTQQPLQVRHALCLGWNCMMTLLVVLSIGRVMRYLSNSRQRFSALLKLVSPAILVSLPFWLPLSVIQEETRWVSLAIGLAMSLITIKVIVFSMARQAYAVVQWDIVPAVVATIWTRDDPRLTEKGIHLLWQLLSVWYLIRIRQWAAAAIHQLCERLEIDLFRIKKKQV